MHVLLLGVIRISSELVKERDDWSWGYVDTPLLYPKEPNEEYTITTFSSVPTEATTVSSFNGSQYCEPYPPQVPDFTAPDRRISQVKCYEYIWHIKYRKILEERNSKCTQYRIEERKRLQISYLAAVGGRSTSAGEFPHMGALGWKAAVGTWIFKCGASLISSKYVMTAAHCTKVPSDTSIADPAPKIVRLGDKNIIDEFSNGVSPLDAVISKIVVHPLYRAPIKYFDIALVELATQVEFTYLVQPACLWPYEDTSSLGTRATLTGWGVVETVKHTTSPELQAAEVEIIEPQLCDKLMKRYCNRNWCGVRDQICAGNLTGGVDACQGDSGGPLQVRISLPMSSEGAMHYVIGITSFGIGCARENIPGVYTRVSSYVDWIEDIVWK